MSIPRILYATFISQLATKLDISSYSHRPPQPHFIKAQLKSGELQYISVIEMPKVGAVIFHLSSVVSSVTKKEGLGASV